MTTSAILAWCGTVLGLGRTVPQLLMVRRARVLDGLSINSCAGLVLSMLWWDIYAVGIRDVPLIVSSVGASTAPVLTFVVLMRRGLTMRAHGAVIMAGTALGGASLLIDTGIVGSLASGSTVLYTLPQFWRLVRTRDVRGVSAVTWILTAVNTSIWAVYGVREQILPAVFPALLLLPTAGLVIGLKVRSAWRRPGVLEDSAAANCE